MAGLLSLKVSTLSALVVVTASYVVSVSTPATSRGVLRESPRRPVSSLSPTTLPTTSLSVCNPLDPPLYVHVLTIITGTNTLTKSAIVQIDAAPFRQWYEAHYGTTLGKRRGAKAEAVVAEEVTKSKSVERKLAARQVNAKVEGALETQFSAGRILACVSSRPGQSGRVDVIHTGHAQAAHALPK